MGKPRWLLKRIIHQFSFFFHICFRVHAGLEASREHGGGEQNSYHFIKLTWLRHVRMCKGGVKGAVSIDTLLFLFIFWKYKFINQFFLKYILRISRIENPTIVTTIPSLLGISHFVLNNLENSPLFKLI